MRKAVKGQEKHSNQIETNLHDVADTDVRSIAKSCAREVGSGSRNEEVKVRALETTIAELEATVSSLLMQKKDLME